MSQRCHPAANRIFGTDQQAVGTSKPGARVAARLIIGSNLGRMLHWDGFARLFILQAANGRVGLLRRLIADFVQDFCDWRGCCRGLRTVPFVDCGEEIVGRIV